MNDHRIICKLFELVKLQEEMISDAGSRSFCPGLQQRYRQVKSEIEVLLKTD